MDGTEYTQSAALLHYAGKIAGLYPEDPLAALKVRMPCCTGAFACFLVRVAAAANLPFMKCYQNYRVNESTGKIAVPPFTLNIYMYS